MTEEKKESIEKLPKQKKVFSYDYNGKLIGETKAELDQISKKDYIIPAFSTDKKPLKQKEGFEIFFKNNEWVYVEIVKVEAVEEGDEQVLTWEQNRQMNYPNIFDYIDGVVKDDKKQIKKYIDECLAVKKQFPKPEEAKEDGKPKKEKHKK